MGAGLVEPRESAPDVPRVIPTTGMRGGLGRTLLTAFLILTILPLVVIGGYAAQQNRRNLEEEAASRLLAIAALKGEMLLRWIEELQAITASVEGGSIRSAPAETWVRLEEQVPELRGAVVLESGGTPVWQFGGCERAVEDHMPSLSSVSSGSLPTPFALYTPESVAVVPVSTPGGTWILCLQDAALDGVINTDAGIGESGRVRLIVASSVWPSAWGSVEPFLDSGIDISEPRTAMYEDEEGEQVIGAFYPLPNLDGGVLVEQAQTEVLVSTERIAATLIALVMAVALCSTAIAAVVIRQITRPVIELTESALAMAEGDLDQHLSVRSRDEIGILTFVFNEMAAELRSLYKDLEAKVVERTRRLQRANYQIQRRALHLQASQRVSQAITSIRDPDLLLGQVTDLIRDYFIYSSVAAYLVAPGGGEARLQASSPQPGPEELEGSHDGWPQKLRAGDGSIVGRALRKGTSQVHNEPAPSEYGWNTLMVSRAAIPMKMEDRMVGIIGVLTTVHEGIQEDELEVLEVLANQVTIALENARAYERERLAIEHLETAEAFKGRFLANMSHELMEPLNTIIGFSRVLLKGIDGPLTRRQREDLEQIHGDSQHLLLMINDVLSISQIQAGLVDLRLQSVDLHELVDGVLPTAGALIRGKEIELRQEIPNRLPSVRADPSRLRQVLVHLLNNAAKFTEEGEICLKAWTNDGEVYVSVSDTGVGIPVEDRERIFAYFEKGNHGDARPEQGAGLGLALCKEFVELHGGKLWVDSEVGAGSVFTFTVPLDGVSEVDALQTCGQEAG
ncbi:MAG: ATP-binding protein [Anaerolineae bacterium]